MVTEEQVCEEIRDYLNGSVVNLNTYRPTGNQFFTSYEGINFNRKDTFPKGEVFVLEDTDPTDNIGRNRGSTMTDTYAVFCYVSSGQKYTDSNGRTRQDEGLVQFFRQQIKDVMRNHSDTVAAITPRITSVVQDPGIDYLTIAGNTFLRGLVTISTIRREIQNG